MAFLDIPSQEQKQPYHVFGIDKPLFVCETTQDRLVLYYMSLGKNSCALRLVRHQGTFTGTGDKRKTKNRVDYYYEYCYYVINMKVMIAVLTNIMKS